MPGVCIKFLIFIRSWLFTLRKGYWMTVKQFLSKAREKFSPRSDYDADTQLTSDGLIDYSTETSVGLLEPDETETDIAGETSFGQIVPENDNSSLETGRPEAITQAFERLVGQLHGINTNLV